MNIPAAEVAKLKEQGNLDAYKSAFLAATFQTFVMRLRSKAEEYQNERKVRHHILSIKPVDYGHESKVILKDIHSYGL